MSVESCAVTAGEDPGLPAAGTLQSGRQRRIVHRIGHRSSGGDAPQYPQRRIREHLLEDLHGLRAGQSALHLLRGKARRSQQRDQKAGAIQRISGVGPKRSASAAQRSVIHIEADLIAHERKDRRGGIAQRLRLRHDVRIGSIRWIGNCGDRSRRCKPWFD